MTRFRNGVLALIVVAIVALAMSLDMAQRQTDEKHVTAAEKREVLAHLPG